MTQQSFSTILIATLLLLSAQQITSRTAEEWKSRSVYQIITDRFAKSDGDTSICSDLNLYCGGTYRGIINNLDYIQGMGFDAIWISPIVSNQPNGYHGYWANNLYNINTNFGTEEDLHDLINECHERDIWVMVDVVANHMGYVDNNNYSSIIPFNDTKYYNKYLPCESVDPRDQDSIETCWLSGLPDLNQNDPFVRRTFMEWVREFVAKWNFDALRIDTVPHVSKDFWAEFSKASGIYTIGEILNFDIHYLAGYQGAVDGVLNYALYSTLRYAFQNGGSMNSIESYYNAAYDVWPDITTLGNFVNNHDNPRFLSASGNVPAFKSALAFTITSVGIPMVYYGDEQAYGGGMDPANREPLWTNMDPESDIYKFLATLNAFRKSTRFWEMDQVQRYTDDNLYAFTRGQHFFAFTNTQDYQSRTINYHPYVDGTILCNVFHPSDCVTVENGAFNIVLINGEMKIFTPARNDAEGPVQVQSKGWKFVRQALGSSFAMGSKSLTMF